MIFSIFDWPIVITTIICVAIFYFNQKNKFFERHGVISTRNPLPFFGHMFKVFVGKEHLLKTIFRAYQSQPDEKFFGFYAFNKPIIVIKDLDLIKSVTVKDFDHFLDHKVFFDEEDDPLFGKNLFFLRGQKWKDMRIAMSPAYTASKMKNMLPFITECADKTIEYFKEQLSQSKDDVLHVEMKDVFTRFTNDVIASTAFGIQINSFREKENDFYIMGKKATNFSGIQFFKFFGYSSCPKLMKLFGIPLFPADVKSFFRKVIRDAIDSRETNKHVRLDMIHLLMLAKKGSLTYDNDSNNAQDVDFLTYKETSKNDTGKREWTHDDLTAQAVAFLLAGFDTSSTLLCFTVYELARHPLIQKKLQEEIDLVNVSEGELTYSELNKMKYMDMVVSESLRMWPPDSLLERVCTKTYVMPPQNDFSSTRYQLNKGDDIMIPTYSIHHDPKNHHDPEVFNPERFSDENKPFMSPFSFIPFGVGPRTCIGARFAVMEAKVMLYYLLSSFDITITPKTTIPVKLATDTFTLNSINGFWFGLKHRKLTK